MRYPIYIMEYIVIHELAHIKHKNHSKDFWMLVENFCPNYKNIEKTREKDCPYRTGCRKLGYAARGVHVRLQSACAGVANARGRDGLSDILFFLLLFFTF